MNNSKKAFAALAVSSMLISSSALATAVDISLNGAFTSATGSLSSLQGATFTSNIGYDTDPTLAIAGSTAFVSNPDGENALSANFSNKAVTFSITGSSLGFTSVQGNVGEADSNLILTAAKTGGLIPDGAYNIFNFTEWGPDTTWTAGCSSTNSLVCAPGTETTPIDGVKASISFVGNTNLFPTLTAGSQFPGTLNPANLLGIVVQFDQYQGGVETGKALEIGSLSGSFTNFSIVPLAPSSVPVPSAVWMFLTGLMGLFSFKRRK